MRAIPDDPIIDCIMRTGYPPWYDYDELYDPDEDDFDPLLMDLEEEEEEEEEDDN